MFVSIDMSILRRLL